MSSLAHAVADSVSEELVARLKAELRNELLEQIRRELTDEIRNQVRAEVKQAISKQQSPGLHTPSLKVDMSAIASNDASSAVPSTGGATTTTQHHDGPASPSKANNLNMSTNGRRRKGITGSSGPAAPTDADAGVREKLQRELLENESSYVAGVRVLIHEYLTPLRTSKKSLVKERDVEGIFLNISDIGVINRAFEQQLLAAAADARDTPGGACFAAAFSAAIPKFRCYAAYASAWTSSLARITKLKKNKPFANFIASVDATRQAGSGFDHLLSTPLSRMAFYESMLNKLTQCTHDPDEKARLQLAYAQMRELQSYFGEVHNQKFHRETLAKVAARIREYDGELVTDTRQYLHEGPLPISAVEGGALLGGTGAGGSSSSASLSGSVGVGGASLASGSTPAGFKTDPEQDYFFLFSDALMYTHSKGKDTYKFKLMLPIDTMRVKNILDSDRQKFAFQLSSRGWLFTFSCGDAALKQVWLDHLRGAINAFHKHKVFGVDLEVLLLRENERRAADHALRRVPAFLEHAFAFLTAHGLETVGIFRLSANQDELDSTRDCIDLGADYEYSPRDPHVAAGLIKLFFRELPQPLVNDTVRFACEKLLADRDDDPASVALVRDHLQQLPEPNRGVLQALLRFLYKIAERHEINKMTSSNLGVVFGPNLFAPREDTLYSRDERNVKFFIDHVHELFPARSTDASAHAIVAVVDAPPPVAADDHSAELQARSVSSPALLDAGSGKKKTAVSVAPLVPAAAPAAPVVAAPTVVVESAAELEEKKKKKHGDRESRRNKSTAE